VTVHELSRADAHRIAVRAQLLDGRRPTGSATAAAVNGEIRDLDRWLELDRTPSRGR
jgi:hypothetical protein